MTLHPDGMAPRIVNLAEWRAHLLHRLERQTGQTGDPGLGGLLEELRSYPAPEADDGAEDDSVAIAVSLRLRDADGDELAFVSTSSVRTALDAIVAELAIESFFLADPGTRARMHALAGDTIA